MRAVFLEVQTESAQLQINLQCIGVVGVQSSYAVSSSEHVDVILGEEASREGYGAVVDGVGIYLFALETQEGVVKACFWMQQGESALEQQNKTCFRAGHPPGCDMTSSRGRPAIKSSVA